MDLGSWIGQAAVAHLLAAEAHWMIVRTLLALGWIRPEIHVRCLARAYRPLSTGQTHFQLALRLVCRVSQQIVAGG